MSHLGWYALFELFAALDVKHQEGGTITTFNGKWVVSCDRAIDVEDIWTLFEVCTSTLSRSIQHLKFTLVCVTCIEDDRELTAEEERAGYRSCIRELPWERVDKHCDRFPKLETLTIIFQDEDGKQLGVRELSDEGTRCKMDKDMRSTKINLC